MNRNQKRMLHPGAGTKLILSQYVATIKCLPLLISPGVLLYKVAAPVRRYLIVANLVGDDDSGDSFVDENEPIQHHYNKLKLKIIPMQVGNQSLLMLDLVSLCRFSFY